MDKLAKKLKSIIKEGALEKYLLARGINPNFISKDQKIAHAKSGAFLKWKNDHMYESADKKDTVVLDIPLLIRVLELAREDIKTDMDLHRVVEKLISIRNKGVLTMADYDTIAKINEEMVSELSNELLQRYKDKAKKSAEDLASKGQYKKSNDRYLSHMKATGKQIERTTSSIRKSLRGEEVEQIDELKKSTLQSYYKKSVDNWLNDPNKNRQRDKGQYNVVKRLGNKETVSLDKEMGITSRSPKYRSRPADPTKYSEGVDEDWQDVNKADRTDGLSQKAVDAYRREHPGSKLKTAVTEKNPKGKRAARRKSFCSRMGGMKKRLTNPENARDPDSPINKALRRWNC